MKLNLTQVVGLTFLIVLSVPSAPAAISLRVERVAPGKTQSDELKALLGAPIRMVREGASREFYFYDGGAGASMTATVAVRKGVVEYVSYLCKDSLKDIRARFGEKKGTSHALSTATSGVSSKLVQLSYEDSGRGFIYEPKSQKVRACLSWEPGKKFEELGR